VCVCVCLDKCRATCGFFAHRISQHNSNVTLHLLWLVGQEVCSLVLVLHKLELFLKTAFSSVANLEKSLVEKCLLNILCIFKWGTNRDGVLFELQLFILAFSNSDSK